jgi:hypothetical protein
MHSDRGYVAQTGCKLIVARPHWLRCPPTQKVKCKERKSKVVKKMESANIMLFFFSEAVFGRTNLQIFMRKQLDKIAIKQRMKTVF